MVKLRNFKLGDEIRTVEGTKWVTPFVVEIIYRGYVVAVNRKGINPVFLFIRTYAGEVYYGSSRFLKYGLKTKQEIRDFIDCIIRNEVVLEREACSSVDMILSKEAFEQNERREQVRY